MSEEEVDNQVGRQVTTTSRPTSPVSKRTRSSGAGN
eukprot:gene11318-15227_t